MANSDREGYVSRGRSYTNLLASKVHFKWLEKVFGLQLVVGDRISRFRWIFVGEFQLSPAT